MRLYPFLLRLALPATLLLSTSACSESTGPEEPALIDIAVLPQGGPFLGNESDSLPSISCTVDLHMTVLSEAPISWTGGAIFFAVGRNRSVPVDTVPLSRDEVRGAWGGQSAEAGDTATSRWTTGATVPFTATFRFRYAVSGEEKQVEATHTCGPAAAVNAQPPAVTALSLTGNPTTLGPSGTVDVDYSASSSIGLWATMVELTGPCTVRQLFAERLELAVTRRAQLVLPQECTLGVPITITVYALDALLEERSRAITPSVVLSDVEPPTLVVFSDGGKGGSMIPEVWGRYFGGDSITVLLSASDNSALSTIVWEIEPFGARDSILVDPAGHHGVHRIPLDSTWSGPITITFVARDAVGLESAPITSVLGGLHLLPSVSRAVRTTTVTGEIRTLAFDERRGLLYLLQTNQQLLTVVSFSDLQVKASVPMSGATDIDITPGGDSLVLAFPLLGTLGIIDLLQSSFQPVMVPIDSLDASIRQGSTELRITANDKVIFKTGGTASAAFTVRELDLRTGAQRGRSDIPHAEWALSMDRRALILNGGTGGFVRYDVDTDAVTGSSTAAVLTSIPGVDRTGSIVSISTHLYDASLQYIRQTDSMFDASGWAPTVLSPDGDVLFYVLSRYGMVRTATSDGSILDRTPLPLDATRLIVTADGSHLIVVESNNGTTSKLSIVDLR